jgi:hypothetical protein
MVSQSIHSCACLQIEQTMSGAGQRLFERDMNALNPAERDRLKTVLPLCTFQRLSKRSKMTRSLKPIHTMLFVQGQMLFEKT